MSSCYEFFASGTPQWQLRSLRIDRKVVRVVFTYIHIHIYRYIYRYIDIYIYTISTERSYCSSGGICIHIHTYICIKIYIYIKIYILDLYGEIVW